MWLPSPQAVAALEDWAWNGEGGDQSPLGDWLEGEVRNAALVSVYNTPSSLSTHPAIGAFVRGGPIDLLYEEQGYEGGPGGSIAYPTYQIGWWRAMLGWNSAFGVKGFERPWRYAILGGVIRGADFWYANGDLPDISSAIGMGLTSAIKLEIPAKAVTVQILADDLGFVNWGHTALGTEVVDQRYTQYLDPRLTVEESWRSPIASMNTEETVFLSPFGGRIRQGLTWPIRSFFAPRVGLGIAGTSGQMVLPEVEGGFGLVLGHFDCTLGATWFPDFPGQRSVNRLVAGLTTGAAF